MPIHDWSRVRAGRFHHIHNSWIYNLSDRLNAGLLPPGFYSAGEQVLGDTYLSKHDHVVVRSAESDQIVALIEIISPGNKDSRHRFEQLLRKVAAALTRGYHLLIIDLHRPGTFDPDGIHAAIWEYLFGQSDAPPDDRPLTLVSYCAAPAPTAYVEPVGVGDNLPDMPLFLDADWYVDVPLESTYLETWEGFPGPWKADLTGT